MMDTIMSNSTMHNSVAGPELTEDELGHVSGGKPSAAPKQEAVFPTETIKLNYGAVAWTYT
jgi:hypothetical protein